MGVIINSKAMFEPVVWRPPSDRLLRDEVYPHGPAPFYPFPAGRLLAKGYCPWALYLDVMWGRNLLTNLESITEAQGEGAHYHNIVGRFRRKISSGEVAIPPYATTSRIESEARKFLRGYRQDHSLNDVLYDKLLGHFLTYVGNNLDELSHLSGEELIIEVDVVNPRCNFRFEGRERTYPIRARLDEVNLTRRVIVERTIERSKHNPLQPAPQKLAQAWLNGYALQMLPPEARPQAWASLWKGPPMQAILETPDASIPLDLRNPTYQESAMEAYYWIREIYRSGAGIIETVNNERACSPQNPNEDCPHWTYRDYGCGRRFPLYPRSRFESKRTFRQLARSLLYDQVWQEDLLFYQLSLLPKSELLQRQLMYEANIVSTTQDSVTVELDQAPGRNLGPYLMVIPAGNFFMGPRLNCYVADVSNTRLTLRLRGGQQGKLTHEGTLLIYAGSEADLYEEKPGWLKQQERSNLLRCLYIGTDDAQKAEERGLIEVMRGSFGEIPFEGYWEGLP